MEQFFLNIYYNQNNKMDLPTLKYKMTLPELLDYQESLEMMGILQEARDKDTEREMKQQAQQSR
tara:strand:- start:30783 stop:30974 length:192 start_codon:yes stop_codon:yes gene_type:complete